MLFWGIVILPSNSYCVKTAIHTQTIRIETIKTHSKSILKRSKFFFSFQITWNERKTNPKYCISNRHNSNRMLEMGYMTREQTTKCRWDNNLKFHNGKMSFICKVSYVNVNMHICYNSKELTIIHQNKRTRKKEMREREREEKKGNNTR